MNKKTIIIILVSVIVIGGVYYGINRWRQQRVANQILKEVYGLNTGGILDKFTGGAGNINSKVIQEMAKEAAKEEVQQKKEEAKEAAKTPEDRFNEIKESATYDAVSKAASEEAKSIIESVFGKAKLTSVSTNTYGSENMVSTLVEYIIARPATGADLSALNKVLTDKGLVIIQSSTSDKTAMVMATSSESKSYSFGFEIDGQTVSVNIIKTTQ